MHIEEVGQKIGNSIAGGVVEFAAHRRGNTSVAEPFGEGDGLWGGDVIHAKVASDDAFRSAGAIRQADRVVGGVVERHGRGTTTVHVDAVPCPEVPEQLATLLHSNAEAVAALATVDGQKDQVPFVIRQAHARSRVLICRARSIRDPAIEDHVEA